MSLYRAASFLAALLICARVTDAATFPNVRAALESVAESVIVAIESGHPISTDLSALTLLTRLPSRKGMFVSVFNQKTKRLRGCMGSLVPTKANLYEEVTHWATMALLHDTRVANSGRNAKYLVIVSFIDAIEPVHDPYEVNVIQHGLLVRQPGREELLLPGEAFTTQYALKMIAGKLHGDAHAVGSEYFRIHAERFGRAISLFKKFDGGYGG